MSWRLLAMATIVGLPSIGARASTDGRVAQSPRLEVNLSERHLSIVAGDQTITYDVAIGQDTKPTPTGNFRIRKIVWNPAWVPPDAAWARKKKPEPPGASKNPMRVVK